MARWDEEHFIERESGRSSARDGKMPEMRGIEAAAEVAQAHRTL
jgi:hypothetical protein